MPNLPAGIQEIASFSSFGTYFLVYISTIIIGGPASFSSLWLAFFGHFGPLGTFYTILSVLAANLTSDFGFYALGRTLQGTRLGHYLEKKFSKSKKIRAYFHEGGLNWLFVAKFLQSTSSPLIFLAGWTNVPFKKFSKIALSAEALWFIIILGAIYILGSGIIPLRTIGLFKNLETTLAASLIFFIILHFAVKYILKKGLITKWIKKIADFVGINNA
ncbi:MAG: VTT domain-containing protein [bacterium]|nr:VTT domain-containing protein [bacterium]